MQVFGGNDPRPGAPSSYNISRTLRFAEAYSHAQAYMRNPDSFDGQVSYHSWAIPVHVLDDMEVRQVTARAQHHTCQVKRLQILNRNDCPP